MQKFALIFTLLFSTLQAQAEFSLLAVSESSQTVIVQSNEDNGSVYFMKCTTTDIMDKSLAEATEILNSDNATDYYDCADTTKEVFIGQEQVFADAFNQSFFKALVDISKNNQKYPVTDKIIHDIALISAVAGIKLVSQPTINLIRGGAKGSVTSRPSIMGRATNALGWASIIFSLGIEAWAWNNTHVREVAYEKHWKDLVTSAAQGISEKNSIDNKTIEDVSNLDAEAKQRVIENIFRALEKASVNLEVSA